MTSTLNQFLKLLDYSPNDIKKQTPRFERAFEILKISDSDIGVGMARLDKYFDMSLRGLRGILAVHFLTMLDHVLAREEGAEKVVYGDWPLPVQIMHAAKIAAPPNVFIGAPTMVINIIMGQIFNKIAPITETGEKCGLAPGQSHCALYQTLLGSIKMGIIPKPDLLLASGWLCDAPSAAMEILQVLDGIQVLHLDGQLDSPWGYWPKPYERQVRYFGYQIEKMVDDIGRAMGYDIPEDAKRKAVKLNGALVYGQLRANNLVAMSDPQPISHCSLSVGGLLFDTPLSDEQHVRAVDAIDTLADEIEERVQKGEGIQEKGAPRVYFSIFGITDPEIVWMIEKSGLAITNTFFQVFPPRALYRTEYKDFGTKVAEAYQRMGPFTSCYGHIEFMKEYVTLCNLDGMIYCYPHHCRTYTVPAIMIKKEIEKQYGIPVMVIEGDIYDSRNYSAEQMRTRVETFAEMLRSAKQLAS